MVYFKLEFGLGSARRTATAKHCAAHGTTGMGHARAEADRAAGEGRFKTAANYLTAARSLSRFLGHDDWLFAELTPRLLHDYQCWLCSRGLCMNTVSAYMRSLRTLYRRTPAAAMADPAAASPFQAVYTGRTATAKRSICEADIKRLNALPLPEGSSLALARDIFMFSFLAMGMPFVDIAYLRKEQIRGGEIHYARHKTAQKVCVAIEPHMAEIMGRHASDESEYVFPILRSADGSAALHHAYRTRLRAYNYALARLSRLAHLSQPLSSYVARHSWASLAYAHDFDLRLIAKAMGHTKLSTTLVYIRSLLDPTLADANRRMMQSMGLQ